MTLESGKQGMEIAFITDLRIFPIHRQILPFQHSK